MRILCFFPLSRRADSELVFSGGELRFIKICKQWAKLGNEIHVVGSEYALRLLKMFRLKIHMHLYDPSLNPPIIVDFVNSMKISRETPHNGFDFIYCPGEPLSFLLPSIMAKKKLKIPLVVGINLLHPDEISVLTSVKPVLKIIHSQFFVRKMGAAALLTFEIHLRNLLLKKADIIFPVSTQTKKLLMKMGISQERIFTVGGGMDHDQIRTIRPQKKLYQACYMGAIHPRKGVFDLIKLWKEIAKKKPDAKLLILGDGPKAYVNRFKEAIQKQKLQNNAMMAGFKIGKEKYRLLKSSEIFVFPSYSESFSQVVCEAMACRLPVVAYDLPVYHEFYKDDIAYVETGNINALIEATLALMNDDELKSKLKERGHKRSLDYNWSKIAMHELEIISQHLKI